MSTATVTMSSSQFQTPAGARTRLRLTRRGRAVLTTLASVPLIVGALVFALNGGGALASGDQAHVRFQYVTVESGQSLWSIAEKVAPSADPRDVIASIVSLNQLDTAVVSPGQQLAIPSQYAK
ncbi:LysM peptidoglycan-binding domain-containing protein [Leifsonia sp. NCR5]|uniref:LysM peptidoglycan-binding domain-containing protein n=1 Tax=Leifsonia sp. NCR5 TaxID=1978342 RepID=UPI000A19621C|nr:LysM peptidoglycan-binding domain-containing protein [Leifsonia sp. NCR5]